jgi:hypothetical protein
MIGPRSIPPPLPGHKAFYFRRFEFGSVSCFKYVIDIATDTTSELSPSARRGALVWKSQKKETVFLEEIARQFQSFLFTFSTELEFNRRRGRYYENSLLVSGM